MTACAEANLATDLLESLSDEEVLRLAFEWDAWARPDQRPPMGDWRLWMLMGGRGAGKTRAGAEWVRGAVEGRARYAKAPCGQIALVGETFADAREVMVSGVSGILATAKPWDRPTYEATRKRVVWDNGAVARLYSAEDPDALRGSQFDGAWCDEFGAAATDLAGNQPSAFPSDKPDNDAKPYFSRGERDDAVQRAILETALDHWGQTGSAQNPLSTLDNRPMLDPSAIHLWTWDARPWPVFPGALDVWSDGANWVRGHWLNGRLGSIALKDLLADLVDYFDLPPIDTSRVQGVLDGYVISEPTRARAVFDDLATVFAFLIRAEGRQCEAIMRQRVEAVDIALDDLVALPDQPILSVSRADPIDLPRRVTLGFNSSEHDFRPGIVRSRPRPVSTGQETVHSLPAALTPAAATGYADRMLEEAVASSMKISFAAAQSLKKVEPGDVVNIVPRIASQAVLCRIERIIDGDARRMEAVRVDPAVYQTSTPQIMQLSAASKPAFGAPQLIVLDLPARGADAVHGHNVVVGAFAHPWPGAVDISIAQPTIDPDANDFSFVQSLTSPASIGSLTAPLASGPTGVWDEATTLDVSMQTGNLSSVSSAQALSGNNLAAIENAGSTEVIGFRNAELVAPNAYRLSGLLRGLGGTEAQAAVGMATGSNFVLLDSSVESLALSTERVSLGGTLRAQPAGNTLGAAAIADQTFAAQPRSLVPLSPAHVRAETAGDDLVLTWIRRSRGTIDDWAFAQVPLHEESEIYRLTFSVSGSAVRTVETVSPSYTYSHADRVTDGALSGFLVTVQQVGTNGHIGSPTTLDLP